MKYLILCIFIAILIFSVNLQKRRFLKTTRSLAFVNFVEAIAKDLEVNLIIYFYLFLVKFQQLNRAHLIFSFLCFIVIDYNQSITIVLPYQGRVFWLVGANPILCSRILMEVKSCNSVLIKYEIDSTSIRIEISVLTKELPHTQIV